MGNGNGQDAVGDWSNCDDWVGAKFVIFAKNTQTKKKIGIKQRRGRHTKDGAHLGK